MNGRIPKGLTPAQAMGGTILQASMLRTRVGEIIAARMKQGFEAPKGEIAVTMTVTFGGDPQNVDVEAVKARVYQTWWDITSELGKRGVDPSSGEFTIDPDAKCGVNGQGVPSVAFVMRWKPKAKIALVP